MSFSNALCVLCECPTADGAVLAVHVDKDKLQHWALNVCGHEIAHEIDDRDKICYFCLWQAEFLAEHEFMEESLVWWQGNLELDDAALLLRRKYFEGEVEQCWVQLEEIGMPSDENDEAAEKPENVSTKNKRFKCNYCSKNLVSPFMMWHHMRREHKNGIRCENRKCVTYFHTLEERNKHNEEVHRRRKMFKCQFCAKEIIKSYHYREHVRRMHKEFKVRCSIRVCFSYFKSEIEMQTHIDSVHKGYFEMNTFQCNYCDHKASEKIRMKKHIRRMHFPRTLNCEICNKFFLSKSELRSHFNDTHTFKNCAICKQEVRSKRYRDHLKLKKCLRCKNKFACSGLYQTHLKACRETPIKCEKCFHVFSKPWKLEEHMKAHQRKNLQSVKYRNLGFKCDPCRRYYRSEKLLKIHIRLQHNKANRKQCAHCSKSFPSFVNLKHHLSVKHNLIEGTLKCLKCEKMYTSLSALNHHLNYAHLVNKN